MTGEVAPRAEAEAGGAAPGVPSRAVLSEALEPVLMRALTDAGRAHAAPAALDTGWTIETVHGGLDATSTVYRLRGRPTDPESAPAGDGPAGGGERPWSVILKVVRPLPDRVAPESTFYWRRETSAYADGLLDHLTDELRAPQCYGVDDRPGEAWLWLEDAARGGAVMANAWTADQLLEAACRYGAWNGAYLTGTRALPAEDYVAHGHWRPWLEAARPGVDRLRTMAERGHPAVAAGFPDGLDAAILRFWDEDRMRFLDALERLPQTLQHADASAGNMFFGPPSREPGQDAGRVPTVAGAEGGRAAPEAAEGLTAIDFAFLSVAPVGLELAVFVNTFGAKGPGGDRAVFTAQLTEAYVAGLRRAGWDGDPALVERGWRLATALRYLVNPHVFALLDEAEYARMARSRGLPLDDYQFLEVAARVVRRAFGVAEEAKALLAGA